MPHRIPLLTAALLLTLPTAATAAKPASSLEFRGYTVSYVATPGPGDTERGGRITLKHGKSVLMTQHTGLMPGCGKVPALSLVADKYVALCGNLGGRHYTYQVIGFDGPEPRIAVLDALDDATPLKATADGDVTALVARRDLLPRDVAGAIYFPLVYRLRKDPSAFGFVPVFDAGARADYAGYYAWLKDNKRNNPDFRPALIAALVATQDKNFICKELAGIDQQGGNTSKDIKAKSGAQHWIDKLHAVGYPQFNRAQC